MALGGELTVSAILFSADYCFFLGCSHGIAGGVRSLVLLLCFASGWGLSLLLVFVAVDV